MNKILLPIGTLRRRCFSSLGNSVVQISVQSAQVRALIPLGFVDSAFGREQFVV